ncbi:MAG: hypothetical protein A3B23_02830 [Candidatus Colwellbacteria bacterium RIFCSPLOWO2_01_FULL_48_10]|uniref:DNA 3'-5' helicase n=1 Tax=Candidatus Colwellbacteria bacterium RIFCSPLOWO2_01_FULL_48_10 TaxID=1797690 RepID=A0A1G1Z7E9_9BACT|nr:MAG: hypothetical protein A3B23_02830 [Candidatus Colwellbacteria bacterium RIFCSPLOWO2_01_FULL_48_10]
MNTFDQAYKALNLAQREAVDAVEGPVMVVAGPGTGKTQILSLRIANILKKTDTLPGNVLALTFTESGASAMRRRLVDLIGTPAYAVTISTFHGFCNDIIKDYPEEFPRIIGAESITEIDQLNILEGILKKQTLKHLKPFGNPLYYLKKIAGAINEAKREGVSPEDLQAIVKNEKKEFYARPDLYHTKGAHKGKMKGEHQTAEKDLERNEELVKIYKAYEAELQKRHIYDFTDMLMEAMRELSTNKELLLILQEQYQYILVDEHQDTNNVQNKIVELLGNFHANPNIFVVGDEKQAIYRFQGASIENFLHFQRLYPKAKLVVLEENYRSTQKILDSAHSVLPGKKKLRSVDVGEGMPITLYPLGSPDSEAYFVAQDIKKRIESGTKPEDVAVLYRDNRDAAIFMQAFETAGVQYSLESEEDALSDRDIRKLILLLRAVDVFGSDRELVEAMHVDFLGLDPLDLYRLVESAGRLRTTFYDEVRKSDKEPIKVFYAKFSTWATLSKNRSLLEFLKILARESGFVNHLLARPDKVEKMARFNAFFEEVKQLVEKHRNYGLKELVEYLDALEAHNIAIKKAGTVAVPNRVRLMTAHKSKGQEFEHVYIVNAHDGHWGNRRSRGGLNLPSTVYSLSGRALERNSNEDERRLFYVALTRARKTVTITYSRLGATKREQLPAQFVGEVLPELIEEQDASGHEQAFADNRHLAFINESKANYDIRDKALVRELFTRNGLSVTALNNYLDCPWKYFYQNLLRIPAAPEKTQMYGIAVHEAFKAFFDAFDWLASPKRSREGGSIAGGASAVPPKKFLIDKFEYALERQPMEKGDFKESLAKGRASLAGYYDFYKDTWTRTVFTEFSIRGIQLTPEIMLTGKIDKIEIVETYPMGAKSLYGVNVIDYKTSKPKTLGQIEGTTKDSEGNIKRQLVFYNLLLNEYEGGKRFKMLSGEIDFVEPVTKGKYKKEKLTVELKEIEALKTEILRVSSEILDLTFWDMYCEKEDCEWCALRKAMS